MTNKPDSIPSKECPHRASGTWLEELQFCTGGTMLTRDECLSLADKIKRTESALERAQHQIMLLLGNKPPAPETCEYLIARPAAEWHEDLHDVLWWRFPIEEPPYCGSPLDTHWQEHELEKVFTHWSPIPIPHELKASEQAIPASTAGQASAPRAGSAAAGGGSESEGCVDE